MILVIEERKKYPTRGQKDIYTPSPTTTIKNKKKKQEKHIRNTKVAMSLYVT